MESNPLVQKVVTGQDLTFHLQFEPDPESGWFVVHVVELPGCISQGATIAEAKANIANELESYMEVLLRTHRRPGGLRAIVRQYSRRGNG